MEQLLTVSLEHADELTIILAGYKDDVEKKLYGFNVGMKSRFDDVLFEDFDAAGLLRVWEGMLKKYSWRVFEQNVSRVAAARVARGAGSKGFGNARDVKNLFERSVSRALNRRKSVTPGERFDPSAPTMIMVDVLGPPPSRKTNKALHAALCELEARVGIGAPGNPIRTAVDAMVLTVFENYQRELRGDKPTEFPLNRLFVGNPGTGKTSFAKIYGRILKALNLLSDGNLVDKSASAFVGNVVGGSQKQTNDILNLSEGKVLLIDEAYVLNESSYGKEVLNTLVERVQNNPGDDIAVIMCGYEPEMLKMLDEANPGLRRRFNPDNMFKFTDFTDEELGVIMKRSAKAMKVRLPGDVLRAAVGHLSKKRAMANFGNAGLVKSLLGAATVRMRARVSRANAARGAAGRNRVVEKLTVGDLNIGRGGGGGGGGEAKDGGGGGGDDNEEDPFAGLRKLHNTEKIVSQLQKIYRALFVWKRDGGTRPKIGNFQFTGSAGTGKTTVARVMGSILHSMGILAREHVEETSGKDLTGSFVGQTKDVVEKKMKAAAGGVLFIDEVSM